MHQSTKLRERRVLRWKKKSVELIQFNCVVFRALVAGGGAPETEASVKLMNYAKGLSGKEAYCFKEFAQALEIIPYTLAENAGLSPIAVVTELRNKHASGEKNYGINVRKVSCFDLY